MEENLREEGIEPEITDAEQGTEPAAEELVATNEGPMSEDNATETVVEAPLEETAEAVGETTEEAVETEEATAETAEENEETVEAETAVEEITESTTEEAGEETTESTEETIEETTEITEETAESTKETAEETGETTESTEETIEETTEETAEVTAETAEITEETAEAAEGTAEETGEETPAEPFVDEDPIPDETAETTEEVAEEPTEQVAEETTQEETAETTEETAEEAPAEEIAENEGTMSEEEAAETAEETETAIEETAEETTEETVEETAETAEEAPAEPPVQKKKIRLFRFKPSQPEPEQESACGACEEKAEEGETPEKKGEYTVLRYNLSVKVRTEGERGEADETSALDRVGELEYTASSIEGAPKKRAYVYLPRGYTEGRKYPVLYLLHGIGGDENEWLAPYGYGRGKCVKILDRLMEKNKIRDVIVVFPNGRTCPEFADVTSERNEYGAIKATPNVLGFYAFDKELREDLIPAVERTYSVRKDRESRAIAGLSMGGMQAVNFGIGCIDLFSWIGGFSVAPGTMGGAFAGRAIRESGYPLSGMYLACGEKDCVSLMPHASLAEGLAETAGDMLLSFKAELLAGLGHEFKVWNYGLEQFLLYVFGI